MHSRVLNSALRVLNSALNHILKNRLTLLRCWVQGESNKLSCLSARDSREVNWKRFTNVMDFEYFPKTFSETALRKFKKYHSKLPLFSINFVNPTECHIQTAKCSWIKHQLNQREKFQSLRFWSRHCVLSRDPMKEEINAASIFFG